MCSWITNRRGITYVLLILVQITTNSIPLKRATVTFFFTSLSKSERLIFIKGLSSLSGVPILTEEVRRSGLKAEGYLEAKGIFLFINLYLCNTGLDNQLLSSVSEFTQRRPQFLPLLACGYHQLPHDIIRAAAPRISHLIFYGPHIV